MAKEDDLAPIYTALNIPAATAHPSVDCVQWTDDGQLCLATRTAVYILTPNAGINFDDDPSSVITAVIDKTGGKPPLGWFRTMIEFSKVSRTMWMDRSTDWPTLSIASLDVAVHQVACSPSNVTKAGGCVIATLSTNMDVNLWMPSRNHLKGEWLDILAVSPCLNEMFGNGVNSIPSAQVSSITWTKKPDFGIDPAPVLDASVLILGNRAGDLLFFRFDSQESKIHHLGSLSVDGSGAWITHISASEWAHTADRSVQSTVAYSTSSGSVGCVIISQYLQSSHMLFMEQTEIEVELTLNQTVSTPDGGAVTALCWVHGNQSDKVLFYSKPGRFMFFLPHAEASINNFELCPKSPKLSAGMSSLSQVSGIYYWKCQYALVVSLFDSSVHFIYDIFAQPRLEEGSSASKHIRAIFARAESGTITHADMCSMTGMTPYDGGGNIVWAHESARPNDFSYKNDAKHNVMLITARLWDEDSPQVVLQNLRDMFMNYRACTGSSPLHLLRPTFFHVQHKPGEFYKGVLEILRESFPRNYPIIISPLADEHTTLDNETKAAFRGALHRSLYGWDALQVSRMKLGLADFLWKLVTDEKKQEECGVVAHGILISISAQFLSLILKHIEAVAPLIQSNDIPFVDRVILQSILPNTPPELSSYARSVWKLVHKTDRDEELDKAHDTMSEKCPACQGDVPLENVTSATCVNGHQWLRCSVTSFLLATPLVRTCIGCSRKTFIPLSSRDENEGRIWLPEVARGWVVEQLLEGVNRCLFCGNAFVQLSY